jgi:hypothetical protein
MAPVRISSQFARFGCGVTVGVCLLSRPQMVREVRGCLSREPQAVADCVFPATHRALNYESHTNVSNSKLESSRERSGRLLKNLAAPAFRVQLEPAEGSAGAELRLNATTCRRGVEPATRIAEVPQTPQPTITFTPLGYVERSGGQMEAIILQDSGVEVVHTGERWAGKYRVVRIFPDSVEAIDETTGLADRNKSDSADPTALSVHPSSTPDADARTESVVASRKHEQIAGNPGAAVTSPSLGYIEKGDGTWESVMVDAETVQLVPQPSRVSLAEPGPRVSAQTPILMSAVGFVEKADGEVNAILAKEDEVYVVREGDFFAGRYQAARVSREGVEALSVPPDGTSPSSIAEAAVLPSLDRSNSSDRAMPARDGPLVFQALGSVEDANGEVEAVIADGSQVYIVKQGDVFADKYQAVSVDRGLVLAVRAQQSGMHSNRSESSPLAALNKMHRGLGFSAERVAGLRANGVPGISGLSDIGVNLFDRSAFTGLDLESRFSPSGWMGL